MLKSSNWINSSDAGRCLQCCDNLDWKNTLQMKMYQEQQKRDNPQRKLKRKENGVKETPKMHPNRFSDGWCRDHDDPNQWHNDSAGDARIPHHITMVKGIRRWLGNTRNEEINCTAPLLQRVLSTYQIYGIHREELHIVEYKVPDGSELEESHHYRNNGTIIGLLISKR